VNAALYWIVWISLSFFALGEAGRRSARTWAKPVSIAGLLLLAVHIVMAMGVRHGWSHAAAITATARQTSVVYGLDWGGGVYVNYLFVAVWLATFVSWRGNRRRAPLVLASIGRRFPIDTRLKRRCRPDRRAAVSDAC